VFDDEKEKRMKSSQRGLASVRQWLPTTLPDDRYWGLNTPIRVDVPVWAHRALFRDILVHELVIVLSRIDHHLCQSKGSAGNVVEEFLGSATTVSELKNALEFILQRLSALSTSECERLRALIQRAQKITLNLLANGSNGEELKFRLQDWVWRKYVKEAQQQHCDPLGFLIGPDRHCNIMSKSSRRFAVPDLYVAYRIRDAFCDYLPKLTERQELVNRRLDLVPLYPNEEQSTEGTIMIVPRETGEWEHALRPFRTRLKHFSINSFWQDEIREDGKTRSVLHIKIPLMEA